MKRVLLISCVLLALAVSSSADILTSSDVRSHVRGALSLVSETTLFINQISKDRLPAAFRVGHAEYLRDEALRQARDLREAKSTVAATNASRECSAQLQQLARLLTLMKGRISEDMLSTIRAHIETIKESLSAVSTGQ